MTNELVGGYVHLNKINKIDGGRIQLKTGSVGRLLEYVCTNIIAHSGFIRERQIAAVFLVG